MYHDTVERVDQEGEDSHMEDKDLTYVLDIPTEESRYMKDKDLINVTGIHVEDKNQAPEDIHVAVDIHCGLEVDIRPMNIRKIRTSCLKRVLSQ